MDTKDHVIEPEELMAYLDGEIPPDRAVAAADHLARCRDCQSLAADLQGVSRKLLAWEVTSPGPQIVAPVLAESEREGVVFARAYDLRGNSYVTTYAYPPLGETPKDISKADHQVNTFWQ